MTSVQISVIFFLVGLVAVVPVLYYYYKRNPNPRFRPPVGEMAMVSLFALLLIGGGSYLMGTVLTSNPNFDENALKQPSTRPAPDDQQKQESSGGNGKSGAKRSNSPFPF